jgi:hypothetical protein
MASDALELDVRSLKLAHLLGRYSDAFRTHSAPTVGLIALPYQAPILTHGAVL